MGASERIEAGLIRFATASPEQTMEAGARFAELCRPNDVVGLEGTLGAGKTCFVKGMARGLGAGDQRSVISPSFVLMRRHRGRLTLYHFDAYRLEGERQMEEIGCYEVFESGGVSAIEWADHVAGCLPQERFLIAIRMAGANRRQFALTCVGPGPTSRREAIACALAPWKQ